LGDESELGEHFPELRKLAERASDLLDELFGDFSLQDPPDPDVIVGFSDETIEGATTRLSGLGRLAPQRVRSLSLGVPRVAH